MPYIYQQVTSTRHIAAGLLRPSGCCCCAPGVENQHLSSLVAIALLQAQLLEPIAQSPEAYAQGPGGGRLVALALAQGGDDGVALHLVQQALQSRALVFPGRGGSGGGLSKTEVLLVDGVLAQGHGPLQ